MRGILVPVLIDHILPPLGFRSVHFADLSNWDGTEETPTFLRLISDIVALIGPSPKEVEEERRRQEATDVARRAEEERQRAEAERVKQEEERRRAEEEARFREQAEVAHRAEEERQRSQAAKANGVAEEKRKRREDLDPVEPMNGMGSVAPLELERPASPEKSGGFYPVAIVVVAALAGVALLYLYPELKGASVAIPGPKMVSSKTSAERAQEWLSEIDRLTSLADAGDASAAKQLGKIYETGEDCDPGRSKCAIDSDLSKALKFYKRAEQLGNKSVFLPIANIYAGNYDDFARTSQIAIQYYLKAIANGDTEAKEKLNELYFSIGAFYEQGGGAMQPNQTLACKYFLMANQEDPIVQEFVSRDCGKGRKK